MHQIYFQYSCHLILFNFIKIQMSNYSLSTRPIKNLFSVQNKQASRLSNKSETKYHLEYNPEQTSGRQKPLKTEFYSPIIERYRKNALTFKGIEPNSYNNLYGKRYDTLANESLPMISRYKLLKPQQNKTKYHLDIFNHNKTNSLQPTFKVDLQHKNENMHNKIYRINGSDKTKHYRIKHNKHKRNNYSNGVYVLKQYLEDQAHGKYPKKQFTEYLIKQKKQQIYNNHHMFYQAFYGADTELYNLQTQYTKIITLGHEKAKDMENQSYRRHSIPQIPSEECMSEFIQSYTPLNQQINIKRLLNSPVFIIEISSKSLYFGQMINQKKDGIGIEIKNNHCFQGIFRDNNKVEGIQIMQDGIYRGDFFENKPEGNGQFQWFEGQYYIGQWRKGSRQGKGIWTNKKGDCYNGSWVKGRSEGQGHLITDGRQYKGNFLYFQKSGLGIQTFINGDVYQGNFKQNLPHGPGRYIWRNKTVYQGDFSNGFRNGKGKLTIANKFMYQGDFVNEKPDGFCVIYMPNKDVYQGSIKNGKKHGKGILRLYNQNKILNGQWQNDVFISHNKSLI